MKIPSPDLIATLTLLLCLLLSANPLIYSLNTPWAVM